MSREKPQKPQKRDGHKKAHKAQKGIEQPRQRNMNEPPVLTTWSFILCFLRLFAAIRIE